MPFAGLFAALGANGPLEHGRIHILSVAGYPSRMNGVSRFCISIQWVHIRAMVRSRMSAVRLK